MPGVNMLFARASFEYGSNKTWPSGQVDEGVLGVPSILALPLYTYAGRLWDSTCATVPSLILRPALCAA